MMCRVCDGLPPNGGDYEELVSMARLFGDAGSRNQPALVAGVRDIDKHRFITGAEWGEPVSARYTQQLIFGNPDPDRGLLLFCYAAGWTYKCRSI